MKALIVTEKPSVAQQFAKVLHVNGRQDGYIENNEYVITWCVGHLITLSYPEIYDEHLKKWSLEDLPFLPESYKYEVIKSVKKQYEIVKRCLNRTDIGIIYNAGDSGREGEYIQRLVYAMAGWNRKAQMKRIWIDSQTDEAILNGIKEAKDASYYDNLSEAAYMRAIEDYTIGINFSRALSIKFGYEFNEKVKSNKYKPISVGRVMTCVLGMVVEREREIINFKATKFYKLEADTGFKSNWKASEKSAYYKSPLLYNEAGFKQKVEAEKLLAALNKDNRLFVEAVTKRTEKKKAPLLFNLAELQNECSKRFKIAPDKTLEIAQKLYEAKLTTYPRTDARVLSSAIAKEIKKNLNGLLKYPYKNEIVEKILSNGWFQGMEQTMYCDDSKITDHYAIIPTGQINTTGICDLERDVFHLIIERFLSIFFPPAEFTKTEVQLLHSNGERFYTSENVLSNPGYMMVTGYDKEKTAETFSNIKEQQYFSAAFSIKEGQTTPPKRYTTGTLILAMENAGNLIEEEELRAQIKGCGIGTSSTRAEIIKKLIHIGYIKLNKKTQVVTPHQDGNVLYDIIHENLPALLSPKMTASWEKGLSQIEQGIVTREKYQQILYDYVTKHVTEIKAKQTKTGQWEKKVFGKCPFCGGEIIQTKFGCGCSNYKKKQCGFAIGEGLLSHLSPEQMEKLITAGQTDVISGFQSKNGYSYSARLRANCSENKVEIVKEGDK